jgi:hypothetical protein
MQSTKVGLDSPFSLQKGFGIRGEEKTFAPYRAVRSHVVARLPPK